MIKLDLIQPKLSLKTFLSDNMPRRDSNPRPLEHKLEALPPSYLPGSQPTINQSKPRSTNVKTLI